jgi:hypothetical protein
VTFGQSMLPKNFKGGVMRSSPNLMSKAKSVDKKDVKALENFLGSKPEIEAVYNRPDELPFFYHTEIPDGLIKWVCSEGPNREIMSVYEFRPSQPGAAVEYREMVLKNLEEAMKCRDQHIKDGWEETDIPPIQVNQNEPLNRKERRAVARMMVSGKGMPKDQKKKDDVGGQTEGAPAQANTTPEWKYSDESDSEE